MHRTRFPFLALLLVLLVSACSQAPTDLSTPSLEPQVAETHVQHRPGVEADACAEHQRDGDAENHQPCVESEEPPPES